MTFYAKHVLPPRPDESYAAAVFADNPVFYTNMEGLRNAPGRWERPRDHTIGGSQYSGAAGAASVGDYEPGAIPSQPKWGTQWVGYGLQGNLCTKFTPNSGFNMIDGQYQGTYPMNVGDVVTVEAWVKIAGSTETVRCILDRGPDLAVTGAYKLYINANNRLALGKCNNSPGHIEIVQSTRTVDVDGVFHHVVATKNGSTVKLYIDTQDVTGTVTNQTLGNHTSGDIWTIGMNYFGSADWFNGWIDEVAVYPTALSQARITAHWQAAFAKVHSSAPSLGFA